MRPYVAELLRSVEGKNEKTRKKLEDHHFVQASKLRSLGYEEALRDVLAFIDKGKEEK